MKPRLPFTDRGEAGRLLGDKLKSEFALAPETLVLGLVRGGAVVAKHIADSTGLAWDILIVRKLGAPQQPEYAVGAYAESGALMRNPYAMRQLGLDEDWLELGRLRAQEECDRLHGELRGGQPRPELAGRPVVLTDDGMATGLTMQAAISAARSAKAGRLIVAIPVLAADALGILERLKTEICYLACPPDFRAVGQFYVDFAPVTSSTVRDLLTARGQSRP